MIGDPAILQQSAMECSNETQMEVPENCLPQLSSDDMAESTFQRSWQRLFVLRNGSDGAGNSGSHAWLAVWKPTAYVETISMTGYV